MENEEQQEQDSCASFRHQNGEDRAEILIEHAARAKDADPFKTMHIHEYAVFSR
jgi:hypothetical protein